MIAYHSILGSERATAAAACVAAFLYCGNVPASPESMRDALHAKMREGGIECVVTLKEDETLKLTVTDTKGSDVPDLKGFPITVLDISGTSISNLYAFSSLPLAVLDASRTRISDLAPLQEMPLQSIWLSGTSITNLSPIAGSSLWQLHIDGCTNTVDLSPLRGSDLYLLDIRETGIKDLTPLKNAPLKFLSFSPQSITNGLAMLREKDTLFQIRAPELPTREFEHKVTFWDFYDTYLNDDPSVLEDGYPTFRLQKRTLWDAGLRGIDIHPTPYRDLAVSVSGLTESNIYALASIGPIGSLSLYGNPGLPNLAGLQGLPLRELKINADMPDLSALPAWPVQSLVLNGRGITNLSGIARFRYLSSLTIEYGQLRDLSPLRGTCITELTIHGDANEPPLDLSPLAALPLRRLTLFSNPLHDIESLAGLELRLLCLNRTQVFDLRPLRGMPLERLYLAGTPVKDVSPLSGLPLEELHLGATHVTDLHPLRDTPLKWLVCPATSFDLNALVKMPLEVIYIRKVASYSDLNTLRAISTLVIINNLPVAKFWARFDNGDYPSLGVDELGDHSQPQQGDGVQRGSAH